MQSLREPIKPLENRVAARLVALIGGLLTIAVVLLHLTVIVVSSQSGQHVTAASALVLLVFDTLLISALMLSLLVGVVNYLQKQPASPIQSTPIAVVPAMQSEVQPHIPTDCNPLPYIPHSPAVVCTLAVAPDQLPRMIHIGMEAEHIFGYPPLAWTANNENGQWYTHLHLDDRARVLEQVNSSRNEPFRCQYRLITANKETVWVDHIGKVVPDSDQHFHIDGIMIDITAHKAAEAELSFYQDQLRQLIERSPQERSTSEMPQVTSGIFTTNRDGQFTYVDSAFARMLNNQPSRLIMRHCSDIAVPDWRPSLRAQLEHQFASHTLELGLEFPIETHTGQYRWVQLLSTLVLDGEQPVGLHGIIYDTTMRKIASEVVRESERKLQRITDTMTDVIVQIDTEGIVRYASPSSRNTFGYDPEALENSAFTQFVHPDDAAFVAAALQGTFADAERIECRYRVGDGSYIWLEAIGNLLFNDEGNLEGLICGCRNITERKQAEQELSELNRLKSEFLSTAAHELRTPLTTIHGFSELLMLPQIKADAARHDHFIQLIHEQSTFLALLIDDLLDLSRLEAKRQLKLSLEAVRMTELIDEVALPFVESSTEHHIEIVHEIGDSVVMGDPLRLIQVVRNLISNAVKYSPTGGDILISTQVVGDMMHISVQDHGIGLKLEDMGHLFEKFYRVNTSNTAVGGTGLGLAISKLIVELHHGNIEVTSEFGVGSTFTVILPLYRATPEPTP
ncbi:MAG: PAS domain S-box protein [Anaerolineae bacterium]|nr:PAS domain S-box protein [Anaerolineae bacterium]